MTLMLLDGNSIINRAFYGIRALSAPDGTPTNGVYGFLAILKKLLDEKKPDALCVCFDMPGKTFRHEKFEGYKIRRKGMPDELAVQMPILKNVLDAMNVLRCELPGWEADDLIGTISRASEENGDECLIVTGDKDSFQLISGKTKTLHIKSRMGQTEETEWDEKAFTDEYGFPPSRMIDLKALMGDSSDDIPGVPGIGEKTALELLRRFGSLEGVYENLDSPDVVKPAAKKKLEEGREMARISFELATIDRNAPLEFKAEDAYVRDADAPALYALFKSLGFNRFIEKWNLNAGVGQNTEQAAEAESIAELDVFDASQLEALEKAVRETAYVSVEAMDGLDGVQVCLPCALYFVRWGNLGDGYNAFLRVLFSGKVKKAAHNVKDLTGLALKEGLCDIGGFVFDTALAAYLLDPTDNNYELKRLSQRYLGRELEGARAVFELCPVLERALTSAGMEKLFNEIELPLCMVLAKMEREGFLVDRRALHDFGESLTGGIEQLQGSIWRKAGEEFNIASPKQLGAILFEKLMLPAGKKTKTGWSTGAEVLEKLADKHPIIPEILEYRELTKLKSTYADGLLKAISPDGRIHTSFQMTVTATGRLSSTEPNLQNIPVRKKLGAGIRRMFVAAPGCVLVDADYSQIELRLLAHISGDETMKGAFLDGVDIHAVTASQVFGVPLDEVTTLMRSRAKAVNFGIVYGISAFSLAGDIDVPVYEAKEYIERYLEKYHGVRDYMKQIVEKARADGYVATMYGRRRPLPELKAGNHNIRSFGERVALNMPIQGAAADIMKLAMVRADRMLGEAKLRARLILQVHDELIVECPEDEAETVSRILTEAMENAASLSVPLTAEAKYGKSWHDAK